MTVTEKTNLEAVSPATERDPIGIRPYVLALATVWTLIVLASLFWNVEQTKRTITDLACSQARIAHEKDVAYRKWNSSYGGVYVRVTDKSPPDSCLHVFDRDVVTTSGRNLQCLSYLQKQVSSTSYFYL
jgi:hypothetical protein